MTTFAPAWNTPAGNLCPLLAEGTVVNVQLSAIDTLTQTFKAASSLKIILDYPVTPSAVVVNDINISTYQVAGRVINVSLTSIPLNPFNTLQAQAATPITYSLNSGSLPPGLALSANGAITGTVGTINGDTDQTYNFVIRASNGRTSQDLAAYMVAQPTVSITNFVTSSLPTFQTDDALNIDYYPFGYYQLLDTVNVPIQSSFSGSMNNLVLLPTGLTGDFIEGLPNGIILTNSGLSGTISTTATVGQYLFKLGFQNQSSPVIYGEISVEGSLSLYEEEKPLPVVWITPSGSLGSFPELSTCLITLNAAGDGWFYFQMSPDSAPLPPSLYLSSDGHLLGEFGYVDTDMTYTFSIRISDTNGNFADRSFSITILNVYSTTNVLDIRLHLRSTDAEGMRETYQNLIPAAPLYRPNDTNFGVPQDSSVYYIKGLNGDNLDTYMYDKYQNHFEVVLGPHTYAVARDASGKPLYEVIYRPLYDPQAQAGGFEFGTDYAVSDPVFVPTDNMYLYPRSIRNGRLDLVSNLNFATSDQTIQTLAGPSGIEALPQWMVSEQVVGDPTSVLGYVPALVVAYVLPGNAELLIAMLNKSMGLLPNGKLMVFELYELRAPSNRPPYTTWDDDSTTFDGGSTLFDLL